MSGRARTLLAVLPALVVASLVAAAASRPLDLVLVVDNSGSMQRNDPDFRLRPALADFIDALPPDTRLGVVVYDRQVRMPLPLAPLDAGTRAAAAQALAALDYRGQWTDTPAAIERAVYELTRRGRDEALRVVAFITDGVVDTGDRARDRERSAWLREDVAAAAAAAGVRIYGVAFTAAADFALIQSLARRTAGDYFRVDDAAGLSAAFAELQAALADAARLPEPEPEPGLEPEPESASAPAPPPVIEAAPAAASPGRAAAPATPPPAAPGPMAWGPWIAAAAVLLAALVLLRRRRQPPAAAIAAAPAAPVPAARLIDRDGVTGREALELGARPTMLGRVAGSDGDRLDYVVVDRPTVGRRHALIEYRDLGYWITDQGSVNGTFVNGERIAAPVRLRHGDRIRLHTVEFEFVLPELEEAEQTLVARPAEAFTGEATVQVPAGVADEVLATTVQPAHAEGDASAEALATTVQPAEDAAADDTPDDDFATMVQPPEEPAADDAAGGDVSMAQATAEGGHPESTGHFAATGAIDLDITGEGDDGASEPPAEQAAPGPEGGGTDADVELATWLGTAGLEHDDGAPASAEPLLSLDESDLESAAGSDGDDDAPGDFLRTAVMGGDAAQPPPAAGSGAEDETPAPAGSGERLTAGTEDTTELEFGEFVDDLDGAGETAARNPADDVTLAPDEVDRARGDGRDGGPAGAGPGSEDPTRRRE